MERSPGRWSPSRLGGPPRWLLTVITALVLAGAVAAEIITHAAPPGRAVLTRPGARAAAVAQATCRELVKRDSSPARVPDCLPAGTAGPDGPALPAICVPLPPPAWHPPAAVRSGIRRRRCYPGMS